VKGPTLIECKTYRWRAHTERKAQPDPREKPEIEAWKKKDPIVLLMGQLRKQQQLSESDWQAMKAECSARSMLPWHSPRQPVPDAGASG
jgi:TPP-dependent pyruvate/acetoin dehydrogenase alpha subunit